MSFRIPLNTISRSSIGESKSISPKSPKISSTRKRDISPSTPRSREAAQQLKLNLRKSWHESLTGGSDPEILRRTGSTHGT